jgi:hypothetical protein
LVVAVEAPQRARVAGQDAQAALAELEAGVALQLGADVRVRPARRRAGGVGAVALLGEDADGRVGGPGGTREDGRREGEQDAWKDAANGGHLVPNREG